MKYTIQRLKAIFSTNYNYFILSAVFASAVFLALGLLFNIKADVFERPQISPELVAAFVVLFFLLPVLDYLAFNIANMSTGTQSAQLNTRITKRNLFILAGTLWISICTLIVCIILGITGHLVIGSAIILLLCWHLIIKLLLKYVFTL